MNGRNIRILELLAAHKKIKVAFLAELLSVSQVTLRRDLDNLERRGMIRRIHGYASLEGADDTGRRMVFNYSVKQKIAKIAALTVEEGETIMLESGSCCALFAEELAMTHKNVTIITNSAYIANYIHRLPFAKVILLGGYYQPESQVLVGPMTIKSAEVLYSDKFFMGTDGFIPGQGFTGRDYLRAETVIGLTKRAKKIFILTDASKFNHRGAYDLVQLDKLTGVFTDDSIPKEAEAALIKHNIQLHKVPSAKL